MTTHPISMFIQRLVGSSGEHRTGMTDGELLSCFLNGRDEAALAVLIRRHATMVWGVCRRLLRSPDDAEDAFQATFLVLVRKAATVSPREMVANWLYGVAQQTAVRLRANEAKRRLRERRTVVLPEPVIDEARGDDLLPLVDVELLRLPEPFRLLIVWCDLEGRTRREVARQLGCPEGTVASRLARGRALLAKRLARRGVMVSGGLIGTVLAEQARSACVPLTVIPSTIRIATLVATETGLAGAISPNVAALITGVTKAMSMSKIKTVLSLLLVLGLLCGAGRGGIDLFNCSAGVAHNPGTTPEEAKKDADKEKLKKDDAKEAGEKDKLDPTAIHPTIYGLAAQVGQSVLLDSNKQLIYLTPGEEKKGDVIYRLTKKTVVVRSDNGKIVPLAEMKVGDWVGVELDKGNKDVRYLLLRAGGNVNPPAPGIALPGVVPGGAAVPAGLPPKD